MVVVAPHGIVAKALPLVRLSTHKRLMFVDTMVGLEVLATTLADKHIANVLPNLVLVRRWQRLESRGKDLKAGVNSHSLLCFVLWCSPAPSSSQTSG